MDLLLRTSVILATTWLLCRMVPRATAATRHLMWHLAIVAVLAAPIALAIEVPGVPWVPKVPEVRVPEVRVPEVPVPEVLVLRVPAGLRGPQSLSRQRRMPQMLWPIGSALVFCWYASGYLIGARRTRRAGPATVELQRAAETLSVRPVRVLIASGDEGPFVSGIFRPSIVLPAAAAAWDSTRLHAVLLHELAHVRRGDCRAQCLAQIACAVYWFNPLIWIAAHRLRVERERACDDEVLARGATPSAYAADLLDVARAQQRWPSSVVLAMARTTELEHRLLAILETGRARTPRRATRVAVTVALCALTVVVVSARASRQVPAPRPIPLAHEEDRERATLRLALDSSSDAVPALIAALRDPDSQVREKAALGLGWRSDSRALKPLITALGDADSQVREKAALALGSLGDPRAVAPLEAAMKDPDSQVREKAAAGLMLLRMGGDPDANGRQVRDALNTIVGGLLRLAQ